MPRPHLEFVQTQQLAWTTGLPGQPGIGARKPLSRDPDSGAVTALHRYPPGWRAALGAFASAEEVYVLDGSVTLGGRRLGAGGYAFLPAGVARDGDGSEAGAVALVFHDAAPVEGPVDSGAVNGVVALETTAELPWEAGAGDADLAHMRLGRKLLRDDPVREERTLLVSMSPQAYPRTLPAPRERHPCVEEVYLLAGDIVSEYGILHPGAYFWRPPMIAHGPHGSHGGAFMLVRFVEGRHVNDWSAAPGDFDPDPPYRPVLPDAVRATLATGPETGWRNW
jgi:hypothetical protein